MRDVESQAAAIDHVLAATGGIAKLGQRQLDDRGDFVWIGQEMSVAPWLIATTGVISKPLTKT